MFASKTPRQIVSTPEDDALIAAGDFREEEVYGMVPSKFHNEPNGHLVAFREALGGERVTATGELYWALRDVNRTHVWLTDQGRPIPPKLDHARRVLTRLANLSEGDSE